jgi:feruloyl esterase
MQPVSVSRAALLAAAGAALALSACSSPPAKTAAVPDACTAFATQYTVPGMRLSTETVAAGTMPPGATSGPPLAAHCKLSGRMAERTGVDGKPYHIGFEVRLPAAWNGRLLYQGGGGNDGVVRPAIGPQAAPGYALNRGFAVVTTDAGHQGADAGFGFDPIARVDNAYNAHDKVAVAAKDIVRAFYSKAPERSYFIGCSGGGRQGMMFTQRFPSYFDGVIAMAPAMRVSSGATVAAAWDSQALLAAAPTVDGNKILSNALPPADLALLRKGILDSCDAQDGIVDGLVSNPAACRFDPRALQCSGAKNDSCLAAPQVTALQRIFGGAKDSSGKPLYFGWAWDAGIGHPANDWRAWKLGTSTTATPNSRHVFLMQDALQGYFVTPPDRSLSIFAFDFDKDPARMAAHSWIFDTAADVQLTGFRARGGKLLLAHGMADPIFSPLESEDYYKRLTAVHGAQTRDFARLFQIPGMAHCAGGAATDSWDGLGALVEWVEQGKAPERIVATGTTVFPGRSRPLCPYPQHAQYNGSGNPEDAANFTCR